MDTIADDVQSLFSLMLGQVYNRFDKLLSDAVDIKEAKMLLSREMSAQSPTFNMFSGPESLCRQLYYFRTHFNLVVSYYLF